MTPFSLDACHIRAVRPEDLDEVHRVHVAAFDGRPDEARLVDLLHAANKATPSLVAIHDGAIVAHVVFSPMTIEPARDNFRVVGLGPVGVLPAYQRRGIGSRLIETGISECRDDGWDAVAVLGGPAFYKRFGFEPALQFGLTNEYVNDEHFMVQALRPGALAGVSGLLKYAPEFGAAGC